MTAPTEPATPHRAAPGSHQDITERRQQPFVTRTVVVGVDGSGASAALAWAADEVATSGRRLTVVHGCPPESPLARIAGHPDAAMVELCDPPFARAVGAVRSRLGGDRIELRIRAGDVASALIDASAGMDMLVIGAGASSRIVRRVARGSLGPVVVVHGGKPDTADRSPATSWSGSMAAQPGGPRANSPSRTPTSMLSRWPRFTYPGTARTTT